MTKRRRWWALASGLIAAFVVLALGRPGLHLGRTMLRDRHDRPPAALGSIDDASGLDETRIAEVWDIHQRELSRRWKSSRTALPTAPTSSTRRLMTQHRSQWLRSACSS